MDQVNEKDPSIEELSAKEDSFVDESCFQKSQEREYVENMRKKAMERIGDIRKRNSEGEEQGTLKPEKEMRRENGELVEYLKEKTKGEMGLHQEELDLKKNEQDIQK